MTFSQNLKLKHFGEEGQKLRDVRTHFYTRVLKEPLRYLASVRIQDRSCEHEFRSSISPQIMKDIFIYYWSRLTFRCSFTWRYRILILTDHSSSNGQLIFKNFKKNNLKHFFLKFLTTHSLSTNREHNKNCTKMEFFAK